jgi:hypothetical protein
MRRVMCALLVLFSTAALAVDLKPPSSKGVEIVGTHLEVTDAQSNVRFARAVQHGSPGR